MQRLVSNGHPASLIGEYTVDQFLAFLDAVEKKEAVSRQTSVIDLSVAISGIFDSKAVTAHLDSLRKISEGE